MTTSPDQAQEGPPDDKQQLEEEIAATRERLGDTVEELVAKLDVKKQARAQVSRVKDKVTGAARGAGTQLTGTAARAREKAADTAGQARGQAASAANSVPEPARRAAASGASVARQRPVQIGALVTVVLAAIVAVLLRRKR